MGEIADSMINGEVCEGCGEFFEEPLGYPGKCERCLRSEGAWVDDLGSSRRTAQDRENNRRAALE